MANSNRHPNHEYLLVSYLDQLRRAAESANGYHYASSYQTLIRRAERELEALRAEGSAGRESSSASQEGAS